MASEIKVGDLVRVTSHETTDDWPFGYEFVAKYTKRDCVGVDAPVRPDGIRWIHVDYIAKVGESEPAAPSADHHAKLQSDYHKALAEIARLRVAVRALAALVPDHALDIGGGE